MGFKLGSRRFNPSDVLQGRYKGVKNNPTNKNEPNTAPIIIKKLDEGIQAEANNDGTIFVDPSIDLNSEEGRRVIAHEVEHVKQFEQEGPKGGARFYYDDNEIIWEGESYKRTNDGYVMWPAGDGKYIKLPEGSGEFPWEQEAESVNK
jgi:hypothetical protein